MTDYNPLMHDDLLPYHLRAEQLPTHKKRPIRKSNAEIESNAHKRKAIKVTKDKKLKTTATPSELWKVIEDFAAENKVMADEVKIRNSWYNGVHLVVTRMETDEEKVKRLIEKESERFRRANLEHTHWKEQVKRRQAIIDRSELICDHACSVHKKVKK